MHQNHLHLILLFIYCFILVMLLGSCQEKSSESLPILGRKNVSLQGDTIYHSIGDFHFVNQDSMEISSGTFDNKVYVADFFFTSCPTICPTMNTQMLRIYEQYRGNPEFSILSHTIDPDHDTVAVLHDYAQRLGVTDSNTWHFVTGSQEEIYRIGQTDYMVTAGEDQAAPGGFIHSGAFLLVDKKKRIRGVYDGTIAEDVDKLIKDIKILLDERFPS